MTKTERIARLEEQIVKLWAHHVAHRERLVLLEDEVRALKKRLAVEVEVLDRDIDDMREGTEDWLESVLGRLKALEARPQVVNVHNSPIVPIPNWDDLQWSFTLYPADILPGTANERIPCSWDGSTLDANGHVQ